MAYPGRSTQFAFLEFSFGETPYLSALYKMDQPVLKKIFENLGPEPHLCEFWPYFELGLEIEPIRRFTVTFCFYSYY